MDSYQYNFLEFFGGTEFRKVLKSLNAMDLIYFPPDGCPQIYGKLSPAKTVQFFNDRLRLAFKKGTYWVFLFYNSFNLYDIILYNYNDDSVKRINQITLKNLEKEIKDECV